MSFRLTLICRIGQHEPHLCKAKCGNFKFALTRETATLIKEEHWHLEEILTIFRIAFLPDLTVLCVDLSILVKLWLF